MSDDAGEQPPIPDLEELLAQMPNGELLAGLDVVLLELERRLLRYAQKGGEILDMADEGLVLAARAGARLGQAQSAAAHAHSHLQLVGIGGWQPTATRPGWSNDPRVLPESEEE